MNAIAAERIAEWGLPSEVVNLLDDLREYGDAHNKSEIDTQATGIQAQIKALGYNFSEQPDSTSAKRHTIGTDLFDEAVHIAYLSNAKGILWKLNNPAFTPKNSDMVLSLGADIMTLTSALGGTSFSEEARGLQLKIKEAQQAANSRISKDAVVETSQKPQNIWDAASQVATVAITAARTAAGRIFQRKNTM